ncbi:ABC transporter ATP-binding protein [Agrococcus sp. 1P02AA]|uniref:ABC transporter ATP-binding protein n=1 Tax=Agrococcus sp. 1P02AA TaxID=3132259 RepID=UPI0039A59767
MHIDDLRVQRGDFAVEGATFAVEPGSVVGLVGPNGAGKTTMIRAMLGLVRADGGTVEVLGQPAGSPAALAQVGVVLDRPTAAAEWRVSSIGSRLAPFYPAWDDDRFAALLDRLGVGAQQRVGELSRGQGVKLALASALAQSPRLLVLDEPSSGLDPASRRVIATLIREFMLDEQHAVLFSTHITEELDELADALVIVAHGRVARQGPLPDVVESYAVVRGSGSIPSAPLIGLERSGEHWSALIEVADSASFGPEVVIDAARIDDIVVHLAADRQAVRA